MKRVEKNTEVKGTGVVSVSKKKTEMWNGSTKNVVLKTSETRVMNIYKKEYCKSVDWTRKVSLKSKLRKNHYERDLRVSFQWWSNKENK